MYTVNTKLIKYRFFAQTEPSFPTFWETRWMDICYRGEEKSWPRDYTFFGI